MTPFPQPHYPMRTTWDSSQTKNQFEPKIFGETVIGAHNSQLASVVLPARVQNQVRLMAVYPFKPPVRRMLNAPEIFSKAGSRVARVTSQLLTMLSWRVVGNNFPLRQLRNLCSEFRQVIWGSSHFAKSPQSPVLP